MIGRLNGKVALITGAASGIGLATARLFGAEGAAVVLLDSQNEAVNSAARELAAVGAAVRAVAADVRDTEAVRGAAALAAKEFGRLDILFANAGIGSTVE